MILFLIASLPLLFSFVVLLRWGGTQAPRTLTLVSTFLKGALMAFPGYLLILIARGIVGFSYNGFLLFLSLLLRDQLFPLLVALGGFFLLQRTLTFAATNEAIFLTVFAYLTGFLFIMNVTDALRMWGEWDAAVLFLLPTLRIDAALLISLLAQRFYRWEGRDGVLYGVATAGCAIIFALCSFLTAGNLMGWSISLSVVMFAGAIALFALRFPRAVRG